MSDKGHAWLPPDFALSKLRLCPILSASDMTAFLEVGVHTVPDPMCIHFFRQK